MKIEILINEANQRLDRFLRKYFKKQPEVKLSDIYSRIRTGTIRVNGKKATENQKLILWDEVLLGENAKWGKTPRATLENKKVKKKNIDKKAIQKQIVFEDSHWIFWNKPYDMVVHPGNFHTNDITLNDYLEGYFSAQDYGKNSTFKPAFGFRLDKDTSGLIVAAKDYQALQLLNEMIRERKTDKWYLAVVAWKAPKKLVMNEPLFKWMSAKLGRAQVFVNKEKGVDAKTELQLISTKTDPILGPISLIKVKLYTGRMHQIRVHCAHHGLPIVGDILYGDAAINRLAYKNYKTNRQLLHSFWYGFTDPFSHKKLFVQTEFPTDFTPYFPDKSITL